MNTFGLQRLLDSNQRLYNPGTAIFYVVQNFDETQQAFTEIGLSFTPAITGNLVGGTTSYKVDPPPDVSQLTANYIASALQAGVTLRSGAVKFTFSSTWVNEMQAQMGFATPQQVFEDKSVQGISSNGLLFTIVKAQSNDGTGGTLSWDVYCNTPDA